MKRNALALLLFTALFFPLLLSYALFLLYKIQVKEHLSQMLDKENFIMLIFSKHEAKNLLKWEHASEFEYNGQMYDVISFSEKGDTIVYWVWRDGKETFLKKQYNSLFYNMLYNHFPQKENNQNLIDFFKKLICYDYVFKLIKIHRWTKIVNQPSFVSVVYLEIDAPPPKNA